MQQAVVDQTALVAGGIQQSHEQGQQSRQPGFEPVPKMQPRPLFRGDQCLVSGDLRIGGFRRIIEGFAQDDILLPGDADRQGQQLIEADNAEEQAEGQD